MDATVFGNVTLDILCHPVDDVPRHESIRFEQASIGPGGCGSNVAIGLCALGVPTALVARMAVCDAAALIERYWEQVGLDQRFVRRVPGAQMAVSVGLVDSTAQPRFIHTPGANAGLTVDDLDVAALAAEGTRALHVGGFFVLPGVLDGQLAGRLAAARERGMLTSLDVVRCPAMNEPASLWPCMPHLDIFLCNAPEAQRISGESEPPAAARALRSRGAQAVIVKLGAEGCWLDTVSLAGGEIRQRIPAPAVQTVDTTGAGDAFAAGLVAALLRGQDIENACQAANQAGARAVGKLGAVAGWFEN
ncbi:MAG: carbohydrate kinase family protein [Thermoflexales bacterium]|nr:carbohydrate kinase family protein [Thermoflexales bacterium]